MSVTTSKYCQDVFQEVLFMATQVKATLRIDEDFYEQIKKIAKAENRSINSEILYLLKQALQNSK